MARLYSAILGGLLTLISCVSGTSTTAKRDDFTENLYIQPLPGGYVYYQFEFTTKTATQNSHFELFPRPVAQLATESGIDELYVTLTQGRWLRDTWGPAPNNTEAPTGAEMWAWWPKSAESAINGTLSERWSTLRNAVSGLICASFSTMSDELSSSPSPIVQSGISAKDTHSAQRECIHGALPKEATCTENLTPWVRLLPCRDRAGVGALLNPLHLFDVSYHAMAFRILNDPVEGTVTLRQTLSIVKKRGSNQAKLSDAFPLLPRQTRPNPRDGVRACPLARESVVTVAGSEPRNLVEENDYVNFVFPEGPKEVSNDVTVHRFATGHGQVGGGFRTVVRNMREKSSAKIVLFQSFPFFVRPYFSSLKATLNGAPVALSTAPGAEARVTIASGNDSATATTLEIATEIPPEAEFAVEISFESVFLHFMRHPPDANRGWDLPAGIVVVLPDAQNKRARRLCAEEILLSLPTPDFSMPYNVIMFSCTVVAMFYGGLMSMSTRRMSVAFKNGKLGEETRFMRTWRLIFATVYKFLMTLKNGAAKKLRRWKREKALANGETPEISDDEDDEDDEMDE